VKKYNRLVQSRREQRRRRLLYLRWVRKRNMNLRLWMKMPGSQMTKYGDEANGDVMGEFG